MAQEYSIHLKNIIKGSGIEESSMEQDILRIKLQGKCILDNLSKESNLVKVGLCALMAVCILGKF